MPTKDGFDPAYPLPLVLADQDEQPGIGNARDGAVAFWRVFKAGVLIATATATGIAVLSAGDPTALFADVRASLTDVTASLTGNSGLQPKADQSRPTIQSVADAPALTQSTVTAQALPPAATEMPTRDEPAAPEPTGNQTENSGPPPEVLFRQFQAWAAEKDAQAPVTPVQPVQDVPAQVVQSAPASGAEDARVPRRLMQRQRQVRAVHNAQAEMRPQNFQKKRPRAQTARAERSPLQDARAQDQSAPNAQAAPSFLPGFGPRN